TPPGSSPTTVRSPTATPTAGSRSGPSAPTGGSPGTSASATPSSAPAWSTSSASASATEPMRPSPPCTAPPPRPPSRTRPPGPARRPPPRYCASASRTWTRPTPSASPTMRDLMRPPPNSPRCSAPTAFPSTPSRSPSSSDRSPPSTRCSATMRPRISRSTPWSRSRWRPRSSRPHPPSDPRSGDAIRLAHDARPDAPPAELAALLGTYGLPVDPVAVALVLGQEPPEYEVQRDDAPAHQQVNALEPVTMEAAVIEAASTLGPDAKAKQIVQHVARHRRLVVTEPYVPTALSRAAKRAQEQADAPLMRDPGNGGYA